MTEFPVDSNELERTKKQIRDLVNEVARLSRSDLSPSQYYSEYLNRVVAALAAQGGAIWILDQQNKLKLEYQLNLPELANGESNGHSRLLVDALTNQKSAIIPPQSGFGESDTAEGLSNPTDYLLLLGILSVDQEPAGIVEIFQRPTTRPAAQQGYMRFLVQMCGMGSDYLKSRRLRHMADRQQLWAQLERFSQEVHRSLDLKAVSYTVANEGRRLIESDRVSVILQRGQQCRVEAVSGQDIVDRRSNLIRQMTRLTNAVIRTGERFEYHGDTEQVPPTLEMLLTEYLDESGSKSILIEPLFPPNEGTEEAGCIGALVVERIDDATPDQAMAERVQIVNQHSANALKNALEYDSVFLLSLWKMLGNWKTFLRGRKLVKLLLTIGVLSTIIASMMYVPWDFRPQAEGKLLPYARGNVYSPIAAEIAEVLVEEGAEVKQDQLLIKLRDPNLVLERQRVEHEIAQVQADMSVLQRTLRGTRQVSFSERVQIEGQLKAKQSQQQSLVRQLVIIREKQEQLEIHSPQDGIITTWKPKQRLSMGRPVQRGDLLLEVVDDKGPWIIEAKMPEERMGHVLQAEERLVGQEKLEVEFILASQPDTSYPGIVTEIGHRARLDNDLNVVLLTIEPTLDAMGQLKKSDAEFAVTGSEVRAKVNCGVRSLGYVLFVDLIEFVHSRVLF